MMAQCSFDYRVIAPVQAAIANWENEGGAVLPMSRTPTHSRPTHKMRFERPRKTDSTQHQAQ